MNVYGGAKASRWPNVSTNRVSGIDEFKGPSVISTRMKGENQGYRFETGTQRLVERFRVTGRWEDFPTSKTLPMGGSRTVEQLTSMLRMSASLYGRINPRSLRLRFQSRK